MSYCIMSRALHLWDARAGARHALRVDPAAGPQTLRLQVQSLTGVPPHRQILSLAWSSASTAAAAAAADAPNLRGAAAAAPDTAAVVVASLPPAVSLDDGRPRPTSFAPYVLTPDRLARLFAADAAADLPPVVGVLVVDGDPVVHPPSPHDAPARAALRVFGPMHVAQTQAVLLGSHGAAAGAAGGRFLQRCAGNVEHCQLYEDLDLRLCALSKVPLGKLCADAAADGSKPMLAFADNLYRHLGKWFKAHFFKWTNAVPCARCGGKTACVGRSGPTAEERAGLAGTVEVYKCNVCGSHTRFPRYNHPRKLLETRQGRCGEWANCFTLCCRAVGLEARQAHDWTDHVWTEVYSEHLKRWVHFDSCENAYDSPLMYEGGWGKKLTYVVACSKEGTCDVTARYSNKYDPDVLGRRRGQMREEWVASVVRVLDTKARIEWAIKTGSGLGRWVELGHRRAAEQAELAKRKRSPAEKAAAAAAAASAADAATANTAPSDAGESKALTAAEKRGRTSGDAAWRAQRGELGTGAAKAAALSPVPEEDTPTAGESKSDAAAVQPTTNDPQEGLRLRVRELFTELTAGGMEPNAAAARAVEMAKLEFSG